MSPAAKMSGTAVSAPSSKRREWDAIAALIAALIGLLALAVSGYTAMLQREQVRAAVWPYLQPVLTIEQGKLAVSIENNGVGPALVGGLRMYVDGEPHQRWPDVFDALGLTDLRDTRASTVNGVVIAPGDTVQQFEFDNAADLQRVLVQVPRIARVLCYCSTLGDCWLLDERELRPAHRRTPVAACPARDSNEFLDNEKPPAPQGTRPAVTPTAPHRLGGFPRFLQIINRVS